MITLAFETSCDETSVAVLENEKVFSNIIYSQISHSEFGGVVPEIASREHMMKIVEVTERALKESGKKLNDVNLVAATNEPGLIGAVLIGLNFAKSVALSLNVPFIPVNHIHSHIYSTFLKDEKPDFPFLSLIISGGHTLLVRVENFFAHKIIGTTIDDAAGEAFDKVAKMLGLGYPGGPFIDRLSEYGNPDFHKFPISVIKDNPYNFSFSGLKTSVLYFLRKLNEDGQEINENLTADISASFQKTLVTTLLNKTLAAARKYGIKNISVSGGVSANSELQKRFLESGKQGFKIFIPDIRYTVDNAGMVGITGYYKYINSREKDYFINDSFDCKANPRLDFEVF